MFDYLGKKKHFNMDVCIVFFLTEQQKYRWEKNNISEQFL